MEAITGPSERRWTPAADGSPEMSRASGVILLDLTGQDRDITNYESAIRRGLEQLSSIERVDSTGVHRPWDFLVVDLPDGPMKNRALYEELLSHPTEPRLLLIVDGSNVADASNDWPLSLSPMFQANANRARVLVLRSLTGCTWRTSEIVPDGICFWKDDETGSWNREILQETLRLPEMFDEVFTSTKDIGAQLWSAGTFQQWFGSLPPRALEDAVFEVGRSLVGDDARLTVLRKLDQWFGKVSQKLQGSETEEQILQPDGAKDKQYKGISTSHSAANGAFGMTSRRRGVISRLVGFPSKQQSALGRLQNVLQETEQDNINLLTELDPRDGWDFEEVKKFRQRGLQLNRGDSLRSDRYSGSEHELLEELLKEFDDALAADYSLATTKHELALLRERVAPRDKNELISGRNYSEPYEELALAAAGHEGVSFSQLIDQLKAAEATPPRSLAIMIGKRAARIINTSWSRVLCAFMYLWLTLIVVFEIWGLSDGLPSMLPVPSEARDVAKTVVLITYLILSLLILVCGVSMINASAEIQEWGGKSGLKKIPEASKRNREFLEQVVVNEWVLFSFRKSATDFIDGLTISMEKLEEMVRDLLITPNEGLSAEGTPPRIPNPAVRVMGGELGQAAWYRQMSHVRKILRQEVVDQIRHQYRVRTPEFRTQRWASVAEELVSDLHEPTRRYLERIAETGVLHVDSSMGKDEIQRRRDLAKDYWGSFAEIANRIDSVVLLGKDDSMMQFIRSDDVTSLNRDEASITTIRFAPEPSRPIFSANGTFLGGITFTSATELAGVLRLVPYRNGLAQYEQD